MCLLRLYKQNKKNPSYMFQKIGLDNLDLEFIVLPLLGYSWPNPSYFNWYSTSCRDFIFSTYISFLSDLRNFHSCFHLQTLLQTNDNAGHLRTAVTKFGQKNNRYQFLLSLLFQLSVSIF